MSKNKVNTELQAKIDKMNQVKIIETRRPDGSLDIGFDYSDCPTKTEQHTAHLNDINYLMKKYAPDELAAYLLARNSHRQEILGHDFSQEPTLQDAMNVVARSKKEFEALPSEITDLFSSHVEFLKFVDNPANEKKLIALGILKEQEIKNVVIPNIPLQPTQPVLPAQPIQPVSPQS